MSDILTELDHHVLFVTLNRVDKHNAFDDTLLLELQRVLEHAATDERVRIIALKANGKHFSAGADLSWMQRMVNLTEAENIEDAKVLARVMHTLYQSQKPTLAIVQGAAMGGGVGLIAACDIAIAANSASFCFSEVKLGLIPAVISPYVIRAIGERNAAWLFMSTESFNAEQALRYQLIHHIVTQENLLTMATEYAHKLSKLPPEACRQAKALVHHVGRCKIDESLQTFTATKIAKQRVSHEGQRGIRAFLNKETISWE
jgi:methylglutaconyl-CoA hydratase